MPVISNHILTEDFIDQLSQKDLCVSNSKVIADDDLPGITFELNIFVNCIRVKNDDGQILNLCGKIKNVFSHLLFVDEIIDIQISIDDSEPISVYPASYRNYIERTVIPNCNQRSDFNALLITFYIKVRPKGVSYRKFFSDYMSIYMNLLRPLKYLSIGLPKLLVEYNSDDLV